MEYIDSLDDLAYISRLEAQRKELLDALCDMTKCVKAYERHLGVAAFHNRIEQAEEVIRSVSGGDSE
jgi:hypothetical protein